MGSSFFPSSFVANSSNMLMWKNNQMPSYAMLKALIGNLQIHQQPQINLINFTERLILEISFEKSLINQFNFNYVNQCCNT